MTFTGPGPMPLSVTVEPAWFKPDRHKNGNPKKTGEQMPAWVRVTWPHFPLETADADDLRVLAVVLNDAADALDEEQANG